PDAPAALSVWHEPHGLFLNTAAPLTDAFGELVALFWLLSQLSNAFAGITTAVLRIVAWPRPQSSVQMTSNVPVFVGVMWSFVGRPGTVSCFCPNSGTQNEWMTSSALKWSSTERPSGSRRTPVVRFPASGYVKLHANCCAVTLMFSGFLPSWSFRLRTIALKMPIAVTSSVGISVQTISRVVWPCVGGPSESSSGAARNAKTE